MFTTLTISLDQLVTMAVAGLLEGVGVPWPGAALLAGVGIAGGQSWLTLLLMASMFTLAYCVGALAQYLLGRFLGSMALGWLPVAMRGKVEGAITRHGDLAVLWTRPFALGNYISVPAGMMRMPILPFLSYTVLGSWPWAFAMILLGRLLGVQMGPIPALIQPYLTTAFVTCAAIGIGSTAWRYLRARRRSTAEPQPLQSLNAY